MNARAVPVLMYHHVSPVPGTVTVSPENFADQMQALAREGYTTPTADEFADYLAGKIELPDKSVLITFDDGYLDNYVHAFPVLQRLGLRAVVFLVTGWIGDGSPRTHAGQSGAPPACPGHAECKAAVREGRADQVMLRWSEVAAMTGTVECHSHTHTHQRWDEIHADAASRLTTLCDDLARSRDTLQGHLGRPSRHLCWPWGRTEPGYAETAREAGFTLQYRVEPGTNRPGDDGASIRRLPVKNRDGAWLLRRLAIFRRPLLARLYLAMKD
jgi:peptidoglycan/xylan/chitin deacetylase (PgdA/CDA1 family)